MTGPIAQIVALTVYGNAVLAGRTVPEFFPTNSTCRFCDKVEFVELKRSLFLRKTAEKLIANSPDEWFLCLRKKGAQGIRLSRRRGRDPRFTDRMTAGFVGGGGTWTLEVVLGTGRSEFWVAGWEVWNQKAPDQRIWRVTYSRASEGPTMESVPPNITAVRQSLLQSLQAIRIFSAKHECDPFTASFVQALTTISSQGLKLHGYHRDISPPGFLSDDAVVVLDAAQTSWVFGGMGSWNDVAFVEDAKNEYERLSEDLFQTLNSAIEEAANTSYYCRRPEA